MADNQTLSGAQPGTRPVKAAPEQEPDVIAEKVLAVPAAPAIPAVPVANSLGFDPQMLTSLVALLLAERQDAMVDRDLKKKQLEARDMQRRRNAAHDEESARRRQSICTHLKGQKSKVRVVNLVDYAVSFHTFVNNESYIRCLICGAKWKPNDTPQFFIRRGEQIPNWTGLGWKDAQKMATQSSNSPTSSEVVMARDYTPPEIATNPHAVEI